MSASASPPERARLYRRLDSPGKSPAALWTAEGGGAPPSLAPSRGSPDLRELLRPQTNPEPNPAAPPPAPPPPAAGALRPCQSWSAAIFQRPRRPVPPLQLTELRELGGPSPKNDVLRVETPGGRCSLPSPFPGARPRPSVDTELHRSAIPELPTLPRRSSQQSSAQGTGRSASSLGSTHSADSLASPAGRTFRGSAASLGEPLSTRSRRRRSDAPPTARIPSPQLGH